MGLWKAWGLRWRQYRYRFVPWIAMNLKNRSVRTVRKGTSDKLLSDGQVEGTLLKLLTAFQNNQGNSAYRTLGISTSRHSVHKTDSSKDQHSRYLRQSNAITTDNNKTNCRNEYLYDKHNFFIRHKDCRRSPHGPYERSCEQATLRQSQGGLVRLAVPQSRCMSIDEHTTLQMQQKQQYGDEDIARCNLRALFDHMGFTVERAPSRVPSCGQGVIVTRGSVPPCSVVAMYPGAVYYPAEPILLQSLGNQFIFRCIDGILLDGNDKGMSKFIFRSCSQRDRRGPYFTSDMSWLTPYTANPLAIGQYVNNHNKEFPANVAYQEFDVPQIFPHSLRQYIPNVFYSGSVQDDFALPPRLVRTVVLVSTRAIQQGEELFSSYFTVVH